MIVGRPGHDTDTMCTEHAWHILLIPTRQVCKATHGTEEGHHMNFKNTMVLARTAGYTDCSVKGHKLWLHSDISTDTGKGKKVKVSRYMLWRHMGGEEV
jgi:hypothetical protein